MLRIYARLVLHLYLSLTIFFPDALGINPFAFSDERIVNPIDFPLRHFWSASLSFFVGL